MSLDELMEQLETTDKHTDKLTIISTIKELIEKEQAQLEYYEQLLDGESKKLKSQPKLISKYGLDYCIEICNGNYEIDDKIPYFIAVRDYFSWLDSNTFTKSTT